MSIRCSLDLLGFECNPDELTDQIGRSPSKHFRKGDIPRPGAGPYRQSGWIIALEATDDLNMSAHVAATVTMAECILARIPDYNAEKTISCAVYVTPTFTPIFYLEPKLVATMARLDVGLDVDIIYLP